MQGSSEAIHREAYITEGTHHPPTSLLKDSSGQVGRIGVIELRAVADSEPCPKCMGCVPGPQTVIRAGDMILFIEPTSQCLTWAF